MRRVLQPLHKAFVSRITPLKLSRPSGVVVSSSLSARRTMATDSEVTIFDKIVKGEIPSEGVYEDDKCYAFRDINPTASVHIVLVPKNRDGLDRLINAEERHKEILGHLMWAASKVAKQEKLNDGWRLVVNDGKHGCQSVFHLHLHIIGGQQLTWPPGTGKPEGSMTG